MEKTQLDYEFFYRKEIQNPEKGFFKSATIWISPEEQFCEWYDENKNKVNIKFVTQGGNNLVTCITVFYEAKNE